MRKKDVIKGLNNQLEALKERKNGLKKELAQLKRANAEIQAAVNAIMVSVATAYGAKGTHGELEIRIPKADITSAIRYEVRAAKDPVTSDTVIRVFERKASENGTDTEGH